MKLLIIFILSVIYPKLQPLGQGVDYRSAHSMESAGDFISLSAEFSSCMKHSIYHCGGGNPHFRVNANRNSSAVIPHMDNIAGKQVHIDMGAVSRQRFVDSVVYNFVYQVVEASGTGRADIHARPLSYRFQSLQHLNLGLVVFVFMMHWVLLLIHALPPVLGFGPFLPAGRPVERERMGD